MVSMDSSSINLSVSFLLKLSKLAFKTCGIAVSGARLEHIGLGKDFSQKMP